MNATPHLLFQWDGILFALPAEAVREAVFLPELSPLPQAPPHILGMLDLRGRLMPVLDLAWCLRQRAEPHRVQDQVVIIEWKGAWMGLVVHEILEVQSLDAARFQPAPSFETGDRVATRYAAGLVRVEAGVAHVLDLDCLLRASASSLLADRNESTTEPRAAGGLVLADASESARSILRERSHSLKHELEAQDPGSLKQMAVVQLGDEHFGFDLSLVREFSEWCNAVPVPGCPDHIAGLMNLRGELLNVIDIRRFLKLPVPPFGSQAKVVIIEWEPLKIGILVDEICEVAPLPREVSRVPVAAQSRAELLEGTMPYRGGALSVLNLTWLLSLPELVVNESVE